jgi:hypothetical protein
MSRTIKTMPPAVQAMDEHAVVPYHNHWRTPCDLTPVPTLDTVGWVTRNSCCWTYDMSFYFSNRFCGCRMCTEHDERRQERRRDRHNAKRGAREIIKYGV